jgi:exodeoxyribonuclease-3
MLMATFNANSIRSRLELLLRWMERWSPDIVCVQETKTPDDRFPVAEISAAGWHALYRGEKSYNGVAILSRKAADRHGFGFRDGGPPDETRLAWAVFGDLTVVNTYVPQGRDITHPMYRYKIEWFARLRRWFDAAFRPNDLLLWGGDLNVAREPRDLYDPEGHQNHVCYHADVRRAFESCLAWGFVDLFRRRHPEPGHYTFYDYRAPNAVERGMGWRVDYLLASPALAALEEDCFIDLEPRRAPKSSDHTFLAARFRGLE